MQSVVQFSLLPETVVSTVAIFNTINAGSRALFEEPPKIQKKAIEKTALIVYKAANSSPKYKHFLYNTQVFKQRLC